MSDPSLPEIPGFRLEGLLGEGASGQVYLARETDGLQRPVALKLFAPRYQDAHQRELEVLRKIEELRRRERSLEIVQSLGSGEHEGQGWIALEYLEDGSLMDRVAQQGPLSLDETLRHMEAVAQALVLLHREGLFHRDVKPANLLLGADGRVRLGDFGLSRELDGTLSAAGSPAFAAPEVIAGKAADGRLVDVYSLGATLAYLLSGETMLPGRPDVFALERRGVPRAMQQLVAQAMTLDPSERLASAEAFLLVLQGVRESPRTSSSLPEGSSEAEASPSSSEDSVKTKTALISAPPVVRDDLALDVEHARCPYCHEDVKPGEAEAKQACSVCMAWHHADCWKEHGACAICSPLGTRTGEAAPTRDRSPRRLCKMALASFLCALAVWLIAPMGAYLSFAFKRMDMETKQRDMMVSRESRVVRAELKNLEREQADSESRARRIELFERELALASPEEEEQIQNFHEQIKQLRRKPIVDNRDAISELQRRLVKQEIKHMDTVEWRAWREGRENGLLLFFLLPFTSEILAFVFGFKGRSRVRASEGRLTGAGWATAGIVIAILNVFLICLVGGVAVGFLVA